MSFPVKKNTFERDTVFVPFFIPYGAVSNQMTRTILFGLSESSVGRFCSPYRYDYKTLWGSYIHESDSVFLPKFSFLLCKLGKSKSDTVT